MTLIKKTKAKYSKTKRLRIDSPVITRILGGTLILLVLIILGVDIFLVSSLIISVVFNSLLVNFQLKRGLPTDLELSTFSTVMVTMTFGLKWGLLIAVLSKFIAMLYTGSILADHFFMIASYILAAFISALFTNSSPLVLGISIAVLNSIIMFLISKNILGLDITSNLSYTGTNLIFNFIIFLTFANPVHNILN